MKSELADLRLEILEGRTQSELIASMKRHGLTIIDAIKAMRELFGVSLGDAKEVVSSHPAYNDSAVASGPLHNEILQVFEAGAKNSGS